MTSGSSMSEKVRGAANVVHGIGENIRGTALGAVDTVAHGPDENKNDRVAEKGRAETSEGMSKLERRHHRGNITNPVGHQTRAGYPQDTTISLEEYPKDEIIGAPQTHPIDATFHTDRPRAVTPGALTEQPGEFPKHHREDAVVGDRDRRTARHQTGVPPKESAY